MFLVQQKSLLLSSSLYIGLTVTLLNMVMVLGRPSADALDYDYQLISAFPAADQKRSSYAIDNVMSAMNNAARLRYGKRSVDSDLSDFERLRGYEGARSRWANAKRFAGEKQQSGFISASRLIDSLNGAERLRFGK